MSNYKSSINQQKKSLTIQENHNDRSISPNYLICKRNIEVNHNATNALKKRNEIISNAIANYQKNCNSKNKKFQAKSYEWSAVCNIKPDTTMEQLKIIADYYEQNLGFQCYQIAIHRDEGHLVSLKDKNITLNAGKDFFLDQKTGIYYKGAVIEKQSKKGEKVLKYVKTNEILAQNIDELKKEYEISINHHAHLEFISLDKTTGKNRSRDLFNDKQKMRELQSKVAEILEMERGADKRISGAERIKPRAYGAMKQREKAERKADLEKIKDLKADNIILEQIADSAKKERDRLQTKNATLKEENEKLQVENQFLNREKEELLNPKEVKETLESFRKQCIGKGLPKEFFRALSAEKQSPKQSTKQDLELFCADLLRAYEKEREAREKAENDRARLTTELESKNAQNRDIAPTNSAALDTTKTTETTQGVETTQKAEPKIDAPIKEQDSFKISADKDFKEILAESNISVNYDFNDENNAVYTHSSLYLPKAKEIRDKLENKGYYVQISANNIIEHQENRIALAFAKSKVAFDKICEFISSSWKSIYKTSEDKLDEIKEKLQQKTPQSTSLDDIDAKMRLIEQKTKETNATSPAELRKTLESQNKVEQMKEQVKQHAYNQRETPKRDLGMSR